MKKIILILALLGLSAPAWAATVTQANMRLSTANGVAFVSFNGSDSGALTGATVGSTIQICDSTSKCITGYKAANGTGETYGSQLLSNTAFNDTSNVTANYNSTISSVAGGQSGNALQVSLTGGFGYATQPATVTVGWLLIFSGYMKAGTEASLMGLDLMDFSYNTVVTIYQLPASWTQYSAYGTASTTTMRQEYLGSTSGKTSLFDTVSMTQVLTPASNGITIVSTQGGSTYNWATITGGFNLNDSIGYTYTITQPNPVAPATNMPTGNYNKQATVPLTTQTSGASICYTTNGSTPTATVAGTCDQNTYSTPITITTTGTTLKALTTKTGYTNSSVSSWTYTIGKYMTAWGDSLTAGNEDGTGITYPGLLAYQSGYTMNNQGIGGYTSSQINAALLAAPQYDGQISLIWSGFNDFGSGYSAAPTNIAGMITQISPNVQYAVLSVLPANTPIFFTGQTTANQLASLNSTLSSTYGSKYLDVKTPLLNSYNPASAEDVIDYGNGITPTSARVTYLNTGTLTNSIASSGVVNFVFTSTIGFLGATFPAVITIDSEKIFCTLANPTGTGPYSYTVTAATRGYAGTTAASHNAGASIAQIVDPIHLNGSKGYPLVAGLVYNKLVSLGLLPSLSNPFWMTIP